MVRANARSVSATCRLATPTSGRSGMELVAQPTSMRTKITAALEVIAFLSERCRASLLACRQPQAEDDKERPRRLREALKGARATGEETPHTRGTESQNEAPNGSGAEKSKPQDEERADLRGAVRLDELGHQRKEKQGHFGVEHVGEHALAERGPGIDRACDVRGPESRRARDQHANAEVDEIYRSEDLHDKKCGGRRREHSRQSERCSKRVNDRA